MLDHNITVIRSVFDSQRFSLEDEKVLQAEIEKELIEFNIPYEREVYLDGNIKNQIDFVLFGNIGMEVKIKGNKANVYRQCARYCACDQINQLILITSKSFYLPELISNKPAHIIHIARNWL